MGSTTDIKKGAVISHQGELYVVTGFQFVSPGKGSAFTKTKMKSLSSGRTIEITYKSGESVDTATVFKKNMQFLYKDDSGYSFMDQESYETHEMSEDLIGDDGKFLKEGLKVIVSMHEGRPVGIELPRKITYKVTESPPAVKGDTASGNVTKQITLDNGLKINAPIFIKEGEEVVVNTETGDYDGRVS